MTTNIKRCPRRVPEHGRHHGAFSLLEMMVVIALLAILATATFLKPLNWFRSARINNGIDQIIMIDQLTRQQCVRTDKRVDLTFDLTNGTMMRVDPK